MHILRPYQVLADKAVREAFRKGAKRVLLVMSTGAGKTTTFANWLVGASNKGSTAIVLAHRKELIGQASKRLTEHYVPHGIIQAGVRPDPSQPIQVASIQSLIPRLFPKDPETAPDKPTADIIICDEAHHATAASYRKVFAQFPNAYILGVTATPGRTDGKGLRDLFDVMVEVTSTAELIEMGYLCSYIIYEGQYEAPDEGIDIVAGDFDQEEAAKRIDTDKLVGEVYDNWKKYAYGKATIVFAQTRKHGNHLLDVFRAHGENFEYVDALTPKDERERIVNGYASGSITGLINVGIFTEGYDVPRTECVAISRMTASLILWLQMCGRGLRPHPGKSHLIILDHGGNAKHRFRGPDYPHEWSLDGRKKRDQPILPLAAMCPVCRGTVGSRTRVCPECGHVFIASAPRTDVPDTVAGMLVAGNYKIKGSEVLEARAAAILEKERKAQEAVEKQRQIQIQTKFLHDFLLRPGVSERNFLYPLMKFKERFPSEKKPKGAFPNSDHGVHIEYKSTGEFIPNTKRLKMKIVAWTFEGVRHVPKG